MEAVKNMETNSPHGYHAIIDTYGAIASKSGKQLISIMKSAARAGGAQILNESIHSFGAGMGYTGVLMLAESHISVHTWPENHYAAFDIFICSSKAQLQKAVEELLVLGDCDNYSLKIIERG